MDLAGKRKQVIRQRVLRRQRDELLGRLREEALDQGLAEARPNTDQAATRFSSSESVQPSEDRT